MDQAKTATWGAALAELRQWAQDRDDVSVTPQMLSVAAPAREEFYGRVEAIQGQIADAVLDGGDAAAMERLARALAAVCGDISRAAGLARVALPGRLEAFAADPAKALAAPLQSVVTDALSGRVPLSEVDGQARQCVRGAAEALARGAYEAWAYLGVVESLNPVRLWAVGCEDGQTARIVPTDVLTMGAQVPSRERRFPEAVVQCADGRVFALKCEAAREIDYYDALAPVARDTSAGGNTAGMLGHRVLLLYQLDAPEKVQATVDRKQRLQRFADLAVEVLAPAEMENPSYLGAFIARLRTLRTRRPLTVVTYDEAARFPQAMEADGEVPPVERCAVGLRREGLAAIAEKLR